MILGIELGSTRIKSVLINPAGEVLAQGAFEWENQLKDGLWTYDLEEVWKGLQASYAALCEDYGTEISTLDGIGVSAMMHGYLAFDKEGALLTPFRTWRNTNTARAAEELTRELGFNIPQRWSASHYYQAVLDNEPHVQDVAFLTTLAGYVHWKLTGEKVLGIGDASGMFPIENLQYNPKMMKKYNALLRQRGVEKDLSALLPEIMVAGECAGHLTEEGARLLDGSGRLQAGAPLCPPEGDAGTGMVATNAVCERTGNVSAGTSAFLMVVMQQPLKNVYPEIDMVTTPDGKPVAMVHVNNFTSEINAWSNVFFELLQRMGVTMEKGELFDFLFKISCESDDTVGGLLGYNFLSGEPIVGLETGNPLIVRKPDGVLNLANFMKMQLYSALGSLRLGMEILEKEQVAMDSVCGHGGFFKTEKVGASAMSVALRAPITVMKNAGEGGAWGIAILALYALVGKKSLGAFLAELFADTQKVITTADEKEQRSFELFMTEYKKGLTIEREATRVLC